MSDVRMERLARGGPVDDAPFRLSPLGQQESPAKPLVSRQRGLGDERSHSESSVVIDEGMVSPSASSSYGTPSSIIGDDVRTAPSAAVPLFRYVIDEMVSNPRLRKRPVDLEGRRHTTNELVDLFTKLDSEGRCAFDVADLIPDMARWRHEMAALAQEHPHRQAFCRTLLDHGFATITIWTLPRGRALPMHSHPGRVVGRMLTGEIETMDLQSRSQVLRANDSSHGDVFVVDESDNCHELTGLADVSTFIEVTFPRYEAPEDCTYFQLNAATGQYMPAACPPRFFREGPPMYGPYHGLHLFPFDLDEEEEEEEVSDHGPL